MKKKKHDYEELIDRLVIQIVKRNPDKLEFEQDIKVVMYDKWSSQPIENLVKTVRELEQNSFKAESIYNKSEHRRVEFCIGVDILGFPIYCVHEVFFKPLVYNKLQRRFPTEKPRFKKDDSYAWKQYEVKQH